jgi:hypothetical protein
MNKKASSITVECLAAESTLFGDIGPTAMEYFVVCTSDDARTLFSGCFAGDPVVTGWTFAMSEHACFAYGFIAIHTTDAPIRSRLGTATTLIDFQGHIVYLRCCV